MSGIRVQVPGGGSGISRQLQGGHIARALSAATRALRITCHAVLGMSFLADPLSRGVLQNS